MTSQLFPPFGAIVSVRIPVDRQPKRSTRARISAARSRSSKPCRNRLQDGLRLQVSEVVLRPPQGLDAITSRLSAPMAVDPSV
jgi:hypothetical protein